MGKRLVFVTSDFQSLRKRSANVLKKRIQKLEYIKAYLNEEIKKTRQAWHSK